jgi:hypothetical protein
MIPSRDDVRRRFAMRPRERRESGQSDMFRARLDHIVEHEPRSGEAGADDRLGLSRTHVRRGV